MKVGSNLSEVLRPIDEAPVQAYLSNEYQVPDLVEWILRQTGKAEIWQSTFSISEEYLRRLHSIQQSGLVEHLTLMLDFKATNKTVNLWLFIQNVVNEAFLADNHSKLVLIRSGNGHHIAVVTSQNLTRGNRNEATVVINDKTTFYNLLDKFNHIKKNYSIPLDEILRGSIN